MKAFWDLIKEVGWIGVVGIFFLVAGMALGFGLSLKDFLDLGSAAWTSEKKGCGDIRGRWNFGRSGCVCRRTG